MKKLIGIFLLSCAANALAASTNFNTATNNANFGFLDILVWNANEGSADNWAKSITVPRLQASNELIDAPFNVNTGFRIGFGHNFNQGAFDVTLAYTKFQTQAANSATGVVYSSFDGNYFANNTNGASFGPNYASANIRWQIFYNTVDLNLGRHFTLDKILQCHPYLGLKAASINQNIYTNWLNPSTPTNFTAAIEDLKQNFWGIGPTVGVDTTWPMYEGTHQSFDLVGNMAAGLLWGHWTFNEVYANNAPLTINVYQQSLTSTAAMADALLGLQWNYQYNTALISVRLAYEAQVWFNQVRFYELDGGRLNDPMSLQGANLEFRLNI